MQYMLLIHSASDLWPHIRTPEFEEMMSKYHVITAAMKSAGVFSSGNALKHTDTATSLRIRGGRREYIDGTATDSSEQLCAYYVLNCSDFPVAISWATRIPQVEWGTVEIRPIAALG